MYLSPDALKAVGFWVLITGLVGEISVLFIPASRRVLEKSLAVLFILIVILGIAVEIIGDNNINKRNGPRHLSETGSAKLTDLMKVFWARVHYS